MIFLRWLLSALTFIAVSYILPGFQIDSFWWALAAAAILGVVNIIIRPLLVLLTLPISLLTLGLFTFVINGAMLFLVARLLEGFEIDRLWTAILAAIIMWLISLVLDLLTPDRE